MVLLRWTHWHTRERETLEMRFLFRFGQHFCLNARYSRMTERR